MSRVREDLNSIFANMREFGKNVLSIFADEKIEQETVLSGELQVSSDKIDSYYEDTKKFGKEYKSNKEITSKKGTEVVRKVAGSKTPTEQLPKPNYIIHPNQDLSKNKLDKRSNMEIGE